MLSKLYAAISRHEMLKTGDTLIAAVSGGADSVALLFGLYLLKDKLGITLEAAHFNHRLREEESDRDEAFVRSLCARYDIPLHVGVTESGTMRGGIIKSSTSYTSIVSTLVYTTKSSYIELDNL